MPVRRLSNLRSRLLAAILLGVAPGLLSVLVVVVALAARDVRQELASSNVASMARLIAGAHQRTLAATETLMTAMAGNLGLASSETCAVILGKLLVTAPDLESVAVIEPGGAARCGAGSDDGAEWMVRLPAVQVALEDGRTGIGPHIYSAGHALTLPIAVPIRDETGKVASAMVAIRHFDWLVSDDVEAIQTQDGMIVILDRAATVLGQAGGAMQVGSPYPVEAVGRLVRAGRAGTIVATGPDGEERVFAVAPLGADAADLFVVVSVPDAKLLGPAQGFFTMAVAAFGIGGVGMLILIYLASRRLVFAPVERLLTVIREVQSGNREARAGSVKAFGELEQIASAFDSMLDELGMRERRFRELFDQSPDAIFVHDQQGRFLDANSAAVRMTGYSRGELCAMNVFVLVPNSDQKRLYETWAALQPGRPVMVTGDVRRTDGRTLPTETYLAPLGAAGSHLVVAVVRDVSVARRDRAALEAARDQAQQASRAKSDFLASMSHELRTPLNAVIGFGETMSLEVFGPMPERYREYARDIVESGQHLLDMITDILDLAKIEAGRIELAEEPVDLLPLADAVTKMVQRRAKDGGVGLRTDIPAGLPRVAGDPRRLKQVLINLLSNAVKFTPSGGQVVLSMRRVTDRGLTIRVSDTGIGMAPEDIPRALEPFGQVGRSVANPHEGTGLGLALVNGIAELHGASLTIESTVGQGTDVIFALPEGRVMRSSG